MKKSSLLAFPPRTVLQRHQEGEIAPCLDCTYVGPHQPRPSSLACDCLRYHRTTIEPSAADRASAHRIAEFKSQLSSVTWLASAPASRHVDQARPEVHQPYQSWGWTTLGPLPLSTTRPLFHAVLCEPAAVKLGVDLMEPT